MSLDHISSRPVYALNQPSRKAYHVRGLRYADLVNFVSADDCTAYDKSFPEANMLHETRW